MLILLFFQFEKFFYDKIVHYNICIRSLTLVIQSVKSCISYENLLAYVCKHEAMDFEATCNKVSSLRSKVCFCSRTLILNKEREKERENNTKQYILYF